MSQVYKIGKVHTKVATVGDTTIVTYHNTKVVVFENNGRWVTLNTGGWRSATTRTRMAQTSNQFNLGFNVSFAKGKFYVWSYQHGWEIEDIDEETVTFCRFTGEILS